MELWYPIRGFETMYQVSNHGRVMSLKCGRTKILRPSLTHGYPSLCLSKDNKKQTHRIHRLVADAFLQPIDGKPEVDHIDRNRANNHLSNLRYADRFDQAINRGCYSNTGHKNVSQSKYSGWYHVVIRRHGEVLLNSAHSSLDEAIFQRDAFLETE